MRLLKIAACAVGLLAAGSPVLAQAPDVIFIGSYEPAGARTASSVAIAFTILTSEPGTTDLVDGSFTYVVPDELTITSFEADPACTLDPSSGYAGQTLTVTGITQPTTYTCTMRLFVTTGPLGDYPLGNATLTFTSPAQGSAPLEPGSAGVLTVAVPVVINSLSRPNYLIAGGEPLTIRGSGFTGASAVNFGPYAASFTVIDDTTIEAIIPPGAVGRADVIVTGRSGPNDDTAADDFEYVNPVPTMAEWAMILLAVLLGAGALFQLSRRRTQIA